MLLNPYLKDVFLAKMKQMEEIIELGEIGQRERRWNLSYSKLIMLRLKIGSKIIATSGPSGS